MNKPTTAQIMEWLVHYQVQGQSWREIAKRAGREIDNIKKPAIEMASFIGLTLREES